MIRCHSRPERQDGNEVTGYMEIPEFLRPISQTDVREIYRVEHYQLGNRLSILDNDSTRLSWQFLQNTSDGNRLIYLVGFYSSDSEPILDQDLERWLCDNKQCLGARRERSRVAVRVRFYLRAKFQNAGLARLLHLREEEVLRKWGAKEVQVLAMDMGRWVWTRPQFGYSIDPFEFQSVLEKYKEWQRARGSLNTITVGGLASLPRDFLLADEVQSLTLFKTL